ncbi:DUF3696 domain-containing protein [Kribbella speibonae]|uniref:DUF3696 domain-containing protein n=1 Tax=Kribbella speibonae TaxID=1572660 RepID=A0A4R0J1M1_9ACTN|nr:DUF3696 domain-containing protein [Kribbella speibonae]TCC40291.1 DUF3696 domain-containing protein [Kribbella speibonae]
MQIDSLAFASIKGFDARQEIGLKNLNLIYGANSSGKSSIFQALLLLQQSAQRAYGADRGVLEFRGSSVDLGGYRTFVHRHETKRPFTIEFGLSDQVRRPDNHGTMFFTGEIRVALTFGILGDDPEPDVVAVRISDAKNAVSFNHAGEPGILRLADSSSAQSMIQIWANSWAERDKNPYDLPSRYRRSIGDWLMRQEFSLHGWFPVLPLALIRGPKKRESSKGDSFRDDLIENLIYRWYQWQTDFAYELFEVLGRMIYVGPLREFPRRVVTEASNVEGVGVRGERLVLHLARRQDLIERVNDAFLALDINYELTVEQLKAYGTEDALGDVAIAVLKDKVTGVSVSPADVGFGLSQILPVVVQLVGNTNKIILVEQPEIHLHPKVQSRLADLLIASSVENNNTILVETHSEHLLLRAQRRLRERSVKGFTPAKLGIHYVSAARGKRLVQTLRISDNGSLVDPWPEGFFDERMDDLFAGV